MQRLRARVAWALTTVGLVISGVALTADVTGSASVPAARPVAVAACLTAGPYRAPEPGSVGVPPAVALCAGGPVVIDQPGALVDGWDVRGGILVDAPDVTVRRSRITGDGSRPFGIETTTRGSVRIEDTTVTGSFAQAAVGGERWSGERVEIVGVSGDGAHLGAGSRLRNSLVHDVGTEMSTETDAASGAAPGSDASGVVLTVTPGPVLLEDTTIDVRGAGERRGSAVLLVPAVPGVSGGRWGGPVEVRGNVLAGGQWVLRQDPVGERTDILITGNRFRRGAEQGPMRVPSGVSTSDNTYTDGGSLPIS